MSAPSLTYSLATTPAGTTLAPLFSIFFWEGSSPKGPLGPETSGSDEIWRKITGQVEVWLPFRHLPCFLSTHWLGRLPVVREEGLKVGKTPAGTMLSPAAPRTTSLAGLWVTPVAPKWILRLERASPHHLEGCEHPDRCSPSSF